MRGKLISTESRKQQTAALPGAWHKIYAFAFSFTPFARKLL